MSECERNRAIVREFRHVMAARIIGGEAALQALLDSLNAAVFIDDNAGPATGDPRPAAP